MFGDALGGVSDSTGINLSGIPFVGGLFPDPNQKAMREALMNASNQMGAQRAQSAAGFQNLAGQMLSAYAPAQNALSQMYGGPSPPPSGAGSAAQGMSVAQPGFLESSGLFGGGSPGQGSRSVTSASNLLNQGARGLGTMTLGGGPVGLGVNELAKTGGVGGTVGGLFQQAGLGQPWGPFQGVFG